MRTSVRVTLVSFLLLAAAPVSVLAQAPPPVQVVVGDVALAGAPGKQPFLENGVTMVPVQPLLQAMGAKVRTGERAITALEGCHSLTVENGGEKLTVDGRPRPMPVPSRRIEGELFAPLRTVAEALNFRVDWDAENQVALVLPGAAAAAKPEGALLVSIDLSRPGTLALPAQAASGQRKVAVVPGTYAWVLQPEQNAYTWSFTAAGETRAKTVTLTREKKGYRVRSDSSELKARVGATSLAQVRSLSLPAGLESVEGPCPLPLLSRAMREPGAGFAPELLESALAQAPALRELTVTTAGDLPADPTATATDRLPYRVETPHAIFLGDKGLSLAMLLRYAKVAESTTLPELARDTGLRPTARKPVLVLYGDKATWDEATNSSPYWGYYAAQEQRIHMAHWKTPEAVNSLLLAHELFHWLAWEEGQVDLPTWLNEGLAHNISWRIEQQSDSWLNPFIRREWLRIVNNPETPVPALSRHSEQDQFTITAAGHLLQTRGRDTLVPFFELTRQGIAFETAFERAFKATPAAFEAEYRKQIATLRTGR